MNRKVSINIVEDELNARKDGYEYSIYELKAVDGDDGIIRYDMQGTRKKVEPVRVIVSDLATTVHPGE